MDKDVKISGIISREELKSILRQAIDLKLACLTFHLEIPDRSILDYVLELNGFPADE